MNRRIVLLAACALLAAVAGPADAKRKAPAKVPTVRHGDTVFRVLHFKFQNRHQNGGYLEAVSAKTGKKLWHAIVYVVEYEEGLESDVQDCFIKTVVLDKKNNRLVITNEAAQRYYLDLRTKKVVHVVRRRR